MLLSLLEALTCAPQGKSWNEQPPGGACGWVAFFLLLATRSSSAVDKIMGRLVQVGFDVCHIMLFYRLAADHQWPI